MRFPPQRALWMLGLLSVACGDDEAAPAPTADAGTQSDGGVPEALGDGSAPVGTLMDAALGPARGDAAVAASPDGGATASGGPSCDPSTQACDKHQPFQLDCAKLPANGACQGGPREVLLITQEDGLVAMLDPQDGHFLGYLKTASQSTGGSTNGYVQFTQGPDQCIWSLSEDDRSSTVRAIERWNTDGSFRDDIIPRQKHRIGEVDRLDDATAFAFSRDHVYVAANSQITRFGLDGSFKDVVLPELDTPSLLVSPDGSLLTSGRKVERWPAGGGMPTTVLTAEMFERTRQLAYDGKGGLLATTSDGHLVRVELETGVATRVSAFATLSVMPGIAQLGNGRWLVAGGTLGLSTVDPKAERARDAEAIEWEEKKLELRGGWQQVGRACLPAEVVDRKPPVDPPVASCAAPAGPALLEEGFESGAFTGSGINRSFNGFTEKTRLLPQTELDVNVAAQGTRSLRVHPKEDEPYDSGVARKFSKIKPSYIGYQVKFDALGGGWAHFALVGDDGRDLTVVNLAQDGLSTWGSALEATVDANTWVRVQLRDIDWTARTYDLYVNCQRIGDDVPFQPESGSSITEIGLYVGHDEDNTQPAYFDEIVIK